MTQREYRNIDVPDAETYEDIIAESKTQVFFSGGHGGYVRYDGEGGSMEKFGGPIDRVFVLRSKGELAGNHGLDIVWGSLDFSTGSLVADVEILDDAEGEDTRASCAFDGNDDEDAIKITGGVLDVEGNSQKLEVPYDTVLFHGTVEPSELIWVLGDRTDKRPNLPYTAFSTDFEIHPFIVERFGLKSRAGVAVMGWCKIPSNPEFGPRGIAEKGFRFETQQHLGSLRLFL